MTFPKYWARQKFAATTAEGTPIVRNALGWSDLSPQDASRHAAERAKAIVARLTSGEQLEGYDYSALPSKEPVLETFQSGDEQIAVITRNRYGCRVLNTDRVLFADIDQPVQPGVATSGLIDLVISFFKPAKPKVDPEVDLLASIAHWHTRHPEASFRVYRTFAGLRILFTDRQFDAADDDAFRRLNELKADRLYVHLTRQQGMFRARLSPKPWRCGVATPPVVSRVDHPDFAERLETWAEGYNVKAKAFTTCQLVGEYGRPSEDPVIQQIVRIHDAETLIDGKPLA